MNTPEHTSPDVSSEPAGEALPQEATGEALNPEADEGAPESVTQIEPLSPDESDPLLEGEPLEGAEEAGEAPEPEGGEVVDTGLNRLLTTPTGLRGAIEALLFISPEPLTPHRIARTLEAGDTRLVQALLGQLRSEYDEQQRGLQIIETVEGYQMATREVFGDLILRLKNRKRRPTLSPAALETLAIIAYRQPIIRAEVEAVRGVESSGTIRNLIDMGLVEMVGRKEVLGRPPMYGTTEQFLQAFGLRALGDLPSIGELKRRLVETEAAREAAAEAPPAPAAAAPEAAPEVMDLPGQMLIEVPEDGEAAVAAGIAQGTTAPPEPAAAEDNGPGQAAGEEEVNTMVDEPWDEDEEEEDEDELEDDEDLDDEEDDEDGEDEEEGDEDLEDEDLEDEEDDEDEDEDEDDVDFEDEDLEDEDLEDEEDEDPDDQDLRDLEDVDEGEMIVEEEKEEPPEEEGGGRGGKKKR